MDDQDKLTPTPDGEEELADSLDRELEELRDLFQTQLDAVQSEMAEQEADEASDADGAQAGEMLIQPLEEIEEETDEAPPQPASDEPLCECCGEKPRDPSYGENYPYCSDCRKLMVKNPINFAGILSLVLMIAIFVGSLFVSSDAVYEYETLVSGNFAYSQKKLTDAVSYYQSYLSSKTGEDNISMKAVRNTIDTMVALGYYDDANNLISTYLSDAQLKLPAYKKYAEVQQEYKLLKDTSAIINENFPELAGGTDFDYKKSMAKADKLIKENEESGKYSQAFLEYAKFLIMLIHEDPAKDRLEQLQKIEAVDGGKNPWIYLTYLLDTAAKLGDAELAKEYYDRSLAFNVQDMSVYTAYADVFRFGKTPDAEKMLEVARQAAANYPNGAYPLFYRTYAIAYLLMGDGEKAMTNMEQYMSSCRASLADFNLYALCALYVKDTETYENIVTDLAGYGDYKVGDSIIAYKNGKKTLEQVLTDNGGEI